MLAVSPKAAGGDSPSSSMSKEKEKEKDMSEGGVSPGRVTGMPTGTSVSVGVGEGAMPSVWKVKGGAGRQGRL